MFPVERSFTFESTRSGSHRLKGVLGLATTVLLLWGASVGRVAAVQAPREVTDADVQAVVRAIVDEIYAEGYQKSYFDLPYNKLPLYVRPRLKNNLIWVIYKLMPYGEVLRGAYVRLDGLAILEGDPHNGFPPTQGSAMRTVYLDDDELIRMKTSWKKVFFPVEINPSPQEVQEAKRRQGLRYRAAK